MNIAFVTSTKRWGGVKTWIMEFSKELSKTDNVYIFTRDVKLWEQAVKNGIKCYIVKFGFDYNPLAILKFIYLFKNLDVDIVCMNVQKEIRTAGIAAKILKIPLIHRVGLKTDILDKFDFRLTHKFLVHKILVPSKIMKDELIEKFSFIKGDDIKVIYNGKNVSFEKHENIHKPVKFLITSKVEPAKGHDYLLPVLKSLKDVGYNFIFDIYGEGGLFEWASAFIKDNGLSGNVFMKGFVTDLKDKISDYDFGVLTSFSEGFPNVILEYMASGLPVISTDVSGIKEIVEDGKNGFLFEPGDSDKLQNLLRVAINIDTAKYRMFSENALYTIKNRFYLPEKVLELKEFFQKF